MINSVSPNVASTLGGTTVIITGTNLTGTYDVRFDYGYPATSFTVDSDTQITAVTPAHPAGTPNVMIWTPLSQTSVYNIFKYASAPDAPTIGTATAGTGSASVTFTAPSSDGGSAITGYTVTSSPGGKTATGTASPITVTGLTNGTSYTFSVSATNEVGTSNASADSNAVTPTVATPTVRLSGPTVLTYGDTVTYTATLSDGASPSGTVTFRDSSGTLGTGTISGGSASYSTSSLSYGTHAISAVYGGDADNDTATSNTLTVRVDAPTISVSPGLLPALVVGSAYSQTITASGGTGPYSYGVTAGTLPAGLSLTSSGTLSGMPTAVGAFYFNITATDANAFDGTRAYSGSVGLATPAIGLSASSASIVVGTPVTLTATLSGGVSPSGTVTFKDGGTTLGSDTVSGGSASYSTNSLATGSHTITAVYGGDTNNDTVTSSAVTVAVNAPTISLTPSSLPNATVGTAYSQTLTASGGTAPYSYMVTTGVFPTGMSFVVATGVMSGTPAAAGSFNFTVTATDAGGYTGSAAYAITVDGVTPAIALSASPSSVMAGTSVTLTATLSGGVSPGGTVTFKDGGTTLGSDTISGGAASYSTSSLAAGSHAITAVYGGDTNNIAATSSAVTVTVSAPTISLTPASLPNATVGTAYSQTLTASGGTAPYSYVVTAGTLPAGLSFDATSGVLSGTPATAGSFNFTVTATDAGGYTGSAAYVVTVASVTPAIVLSASPTTVVSGGSVTLTATLSGGASPSGTVTFKDGGTTLGTDTISGGSASFATSALASGSHSITAAYAGDTNNAAVTSSVVTITVSAAVRPDPSQDQTVTAMVTAQATSSARFGQTQITNTVQRLEQLHDEPASSAADGGGGQTARSSYAASALAYGSGASSENTGTDSSASQAVSQLSRGIEVAERKAGLPFHLWSGGSVDWGRADSNGNDRFTSSGFTVGLDRRMTDALTVGLAGGFAVDHTTLGSNSSSDGTAYTAQIYASLKLAERTWLDVVGGYGALRFDSERWSSGNQFDGTRDGHDLFGSVGLSTAQDFSSLRLTGYSRLDIVKVALDGYAESGPSGLALAYDEMDTTTVAGVAGLKAAYAVPMSWGTLTPGARLEYRHALDGGFTQGLGYADVGGFGYTISGESSAKDSATIGLSLGATTLDGLNLELEYQLSADGGGVASQQVRAGIRLAF
ncbi:Ig-like domain repeat protein [Pleomorphomonas sp. PLEO]|uniref:Ig-like domain repeat protein n=1 Tax=Pleomorphomonas sp. PLEO TaxID=3239306 RepID=UPI00351EC77D